MKIKLGLIAVSLMSVFSVANTASAESLDFDFANKYIFNNSSINSKTEGFTESFDSEIAKQCITDNYVSDLGGSTVAQSVSSSNRLTPKQQKLFKQEIEANKQLGEYVAGVELDITSSGESTSTQKGTQSPRFVLNNEKIFKADVRVIYGKQAIVYDNDLEKEVSKTVTRGVKIKSGTFKVTQVFDSTAKKYTFTKDLKMEGNTVTKVEQVLCDKNGNPTSGQAAEGFTNSSNTSSSTNTASTETSGQSMNAFTNTTSTNKTKTATVARYSNQPRTLLNNNTITTTPTGDSSDIKVNW